MTLMAASSAANALGTGLGAAMGGTAGPSSAHGNKVEAIFDNSGWNVNFDDGTITSDRQQLPALGGMDLDTTTMLLIGAAALVAFKIWAKHKAKA